MKVTNVAPRFVDSFPRVMEPGVLYISVLFSTSAHLCACGCNREVITPISPRQWVLVFDGQISMKPSIGNWALACQSHYTIDHGKVRWLPHSSVRVGPRAGEAGADVTDGSRFRRMWLRLTNWTRMSDHRF